MSRSSESFLLELKDIQFGFDDRLILDIPELLISKGEMTVLKGANGAGKTTLLRIMAGLQEPTRGTVFFKGEKVHFGKLGLAYRRRVTMLAQEPYLFQRTVMDNVMFGPLSHGFLKKEAKGRAMDALKSLGCTHLAEKHSRNLSGGEKKRVALACLLSLDSEVLLLDEPTAQVDQEHVLIIKDLIRQQLNHGKTILFSTHQPEWANGLEGRCFGIEYGMLAPDPE